MAEEEKTVGDILEEEYAKQMGKERSEREPTEEARPKEEKKESKIKFEQEIDLRQIVMSIEKLDAEVNALKEIKFHSDERIKELAESIGELRSLLFQRDASIKETEAKADKLEEIVSEIKPEKISEEFKKREAEIAETEARIEKLERMSKDLLEQIQRSQKILENIKSMENLMEVSKEIGAKLDKIDELRKGVERDAGKTERIFFEMDKRLAEFSTVKSKIDRIDDLSKELVRNMDEYKIKLEATASKDDLQKTIESALKPPEVSEKVEELNKKRDEIITLLKHLESQFKQGIISEKSYLEIVEKNRSISNQIENEIKQTEISKRPESLISWLEQVEDKIKGLNAKIETQQEKENNISKGIETVTYEISKFKDLLDRQKIMLTDVLGLQISQEVPLGESKVKELADEAQSIKSLLVSLDDQHKEGNVSEETYRETKEKGLQKLKEIESQIKSDIKSSVGVSILDRIKNIEKNEEEASKKIEENYEELSKKFLEFSALKDRILNFEINELKKSAEENKTKIDSLDNALPKAVELRLELKGLVEKREEELKLSIEDKINKIRLDAAESLEKINELRMKVEKRFSEMSEYLDKVKKSDTTNLLEKINSIESKIKDPPVKTEGESARVEELKSLIDLIKSEIDNRIVELESNVNSLKKITQESEKSPYILE